MGSSARLFGAALASRTCRPKRLGDHLGARIVLFDGGHCLLIVAGESYLFGESRRIFRGLPAQADQRPFFVDRETGCRTRADAITTAPEDEHLQGDRNPRPMPDPA